MEVFERLLELQTFDTEIAQLEHRAAHLPEAVALQDARRVVAGLDAELLRLHTESARFASEVAANESAVGDLRRQLERLNAQMKTVIAPREAEALQHEMVVIESKISSLEDESLAALERGEECDAEVVRIESEVVGAKNAVSSAEATLNVALEEVRNSLASVRERRSACAAAVDAGMIEQYERRRAAHGGVAVARLVRATCGGCHIDLSTSEVESVRRESPEQRECPNCARWLVV